MASGGQSSLNAVVIGGTGATGRCLVGGLLKSKDRVGKITVLLRRKLEQVPEQYGVDVAAEEAEGRLVQHVEDLDAVSDETVKQLCTGAHIFFNCLGTTRANAGSAQAFRHIDYEIPLRLCRLSREAGVNHCSIVTSAGSKSSSWFLYFRTKGEMEEATRALQFPYTSIFRPGMLGRGEARFVEKLAGIFMRAMPVSSVAQAMLADALSYHSKQEEGQQQQEEGQQQQEGAEAAAQNVMVADNAQIYRLCEEPTPKTSTTAE